MKHILMPTDFSVPAENAAQYAVELAKELKADVLLCNAYRIHAEAPMDAQVAWPLMGAAEIEEERVTELDILVNQITNPSCQTESKTYCPKVSYETVKGDVCEVVIELVKKRKIDLVVMGMAGAGGLTQFILGSTSKQMVEKAAFPLLLVPFEASFKKIKKIVFATNLDKKDLIHLEVLKEFAIAFGAGIVIVHITDKKVEETSKLQHKIDDFLNDVAAGRTGLSIKYEYVWNLYLDDGLKWIAGQRNVGLVAMSHHKHNLLERIFKGSHTQRLSRVIKVPLLVFPG